MKTLLSIALMLFASGVAATEYATVTGVQEIISTRAVPVQSCNTVHVPIYRSKESSGGVIGKIVDSTVGSTEGLIGAVVGGVIGSKIGGGNGKRIATGVGVAIGAKVGDEQSKKDEIVGYKEHQQCETIYQNENYVSGYQVTYDYNGMTLTKTSKNRAVVGSRAPVNVSIR
tara:strand:+ start:890 stop:1402 length:513 start_codon:yes stop_codon:yes gene_type:complete